MPCTPLCSAMPGVLDLSELLPGGKSWAKHNIKAEPVSHKMSMHLHGCVVSRVANILTCIH